MKIKLIIVLIISASILFSGCIFKTETPVPTETAIENPVILLRDYFPLSEGSFWKYLGDGNEYASFTREVLYTDGSLAQTSENNGGTVTSLVYRFTDDEITCIYFQGEEYDKENRINEPSNYSEIILKAPIEAVTKWSSANNTREIINTGVTVSTPLGDISGCIMVNITDTNSYTYEYYKDGIGMVKREFHSGDTVVSSTLEEYNIKD